MHTPSAHIIRRGATDTISGASPTAVSQSQPTERAGSGDSQPGDRKDTAISDPGSQTACPIMCRGAAWRLRDFNALHPFTPYARHADGRRPHPNVARIEKVSSSQYAVHLSAPP